MGCKHLVSAGSLTPAARRAASVFLRSATLHSEKQMHFIYLSGLGCFSTAHFLTIPLLAFGNYAQAYKRASKEEKQDVLIENLLAVTCGDAAKKLKDPSSFFLREAYYTPEHIVLCLSATNGFGGKTVSYCYYSFDKDTQTYSLFANETDLDDDVDISRYDSKERATEKIFDYVIKAAIKSIIKNEENKVSEQTVERINGLFKSGQLQNIELLEEVQTLYPTEESTT